MFTGIITDIGRVESAEQDGRGDLRLRLATRYDTAEIPLGASIACAGVCLTVVDREGAPADAAEKGWRGVFAVDVSAETRSKTTLGDWAPGRLINLERPLKVGDELGGHIVSGHVDGIGRVAGLTPVGDSTETVFAAPRDLGRFIAPKGSIAVDGCSLTVNAVTDDAAETRFTVNLIPHTKTHTSFSALAVGDPVNLEIDMLARYMARLSVAG